MITPQNIRISRAIRRCYCEECSGLIGRGMKRAQCNILSSYKYYHPLCFIKAIDKNIDNFYTAREEFKKKYGESELFLHALNE